MKKFPLKNFLFVASIVLAVLIFDLITKFYAQEINKTIISGLLSFHYSQNTGGAWSIFSNHTWILTMISMILLVCFFIYNHFVSGKNVLYFISFSLIVGGGIGNFIDRLILGYVRDFIKFDFINFPIFNVADMALTCGVVLFIIHYLISMFKKEDQVGK